MTRSGAASIVLSCALVACSPTLDVAPPHRFVPAPAPTSRIEACWVEFAVDTQPGAYGLAGESDELHWDVTFSGLLVRHPKGDLLIDTGLSAHFDEEVSKSSGVVAGLLQRSIQGSGKSIAGARDALAYVGEDPSKLSAIVLSHIHPDHAGGVLDLPNTPVLLSQKEIEFARREKDKGGFDVLGPEAEVILARAKPIVFSKTPYENFDESLDYYGDGAVVFVPNAGHTPGSVGTFVNLGPGLRMFHVGDAANTLEAVVKRRGKSVLLSFTDHDAGAADALVAKLNQLHTMDPALFIVPAHDRKAWQRAFEAPYKCINPR